MNNCFHKNRVFACKYFPHHKGHTCRVARLSSPRPCIFHETLCLNLCKCCPNTFLVFLAFEAQCRQFDGRAWHYPHGGSPLRISKWKQWFRLYFGDHGGNALNIIDSILFGSARWNELNDSSEKNKRHQKISFKNKYFFLHNCYLHRQRKHNE